MMDQNRRRIPRKNEQLMEVFTAAVKFDEAIANEINNEKELVSLARSRSGHYLNENSLVSESRSRRRYLRNSRPWSICPKCNGRECVECGQKGWMNREVFRLYVDKDTWKRDQATKLNMNT